MAGKLIKVQSRNDFTFSLAASGTQQLIIGERAIATHDWGTGSMIVLFHAKTLASSTATLTVKTHQTFFDADNPTVLWAINGGTPLASQVIANADAAPGLYVAALTTPGAFARCTVEHSQGANTGSCTWTISIYLLGRDT